MVDFPNPIGGYMGSSPQRSSLVRGRLLALCMMLTVIGPLISVWMMANEYTALAPYFAASAALQAAIFLSLGITAASVAFGVYAGLHLWLVRAGAVATAKQALLAGLAADVVTTMIGLAAAPTLSADDRLLWLFTFNLVPGLAFFTLCFAYLNRSQRVDATFNPARSDPPRR